MCKSTTGEEEFNTERMVCLHRVGSNFAALIYELSDDDDFNKFDEKCKIVKNRLERNPKLAKDLVSIKSFYIIIRKMCPVYLGGMQQTP